MVRARFTCQRVIYSWLPAGDPWGSDAGCRQAIQDVKTNSAPYEVLLRRASANDRSQLKMWKIRWCVQNECSSHREQVVSGTTHATNMSRSGIPDHTNFPTFPQTSAEFPDISRKVVTERMRLKNEVHSTCMVPKRFPTRTPSLAPTTECR